MGKATNVRNYAGIPVEIIGQKYNLLLTMLGNDYLEDQFGSPTAALTKYNDMITQINKTGMDKDCRDILIHFIYASIIHNQFDNQGNIIREIPGFFEIKSTLGQNDLLKLLQSMTAAQNASFPDPKEGQEEKEGNFQK